MSRRFHSSTTAKTGFCVLLALAAPALAADHPRKYYQKQATWQESMRCSREALALDFAKRQAEHQAAAEKADPALAAFKPWMLVGVPSYAPATGSREFYQKSKVRLSVTGLQNLYLGSVRLGALRDEQDSGFNVSWTNAVLLDKSGKKTPLSELLPSGVHESHHRLRVDGSELVIKLNGKFDVFEGQVELYYPDGVMAWVHGRTLMQEQRWAQEARRQIAAALLADFSDSAESIDFESRGAIWVADWVPGDLGDLARRYSALCTTPLARESKSLAGRVKTPAELEKVRGLCYQELRCMAMLARLEKCKPDALQRAIEDLAKTFPEGYPQGATWSRQAKELAAAYPSMVEKLRQGDASALASAQAVLDLQSQALLANPLLKFDRLLLVRRKGESNTGLSSNFGPNTHPGGNADIVTVSPADPEGKFTTVFSDPSGKGVCDVVPEFDAGKMLFTMNDSAGDTHIWEIKSDGSGLRQVTPAEGRDAKAGKKAAIQYANACYLPDGKIMLVSTAGMHAVPCVGGSLPVGNLFRMDADGRNMMALTFDNDQNWYPRVLPSGRVMYLRWEYTDTAHYFTRLLFTMNPDGSGQTELYGSNSYWPNSFYEARPIPGDPAKVVGIVTGHHGTSRAGELVILDTTKGRREADGVVQMIPGWGKKVDPIIKDRLVDDVWPKFLHPYPLGDAAGRGGGTYFLVSCKMNPTAPWGIYLADAFDNLVPLRIEAGYALTEAQPLAKTPRPPVVPDRIDLARKDGVVFLQDLYLGGGMANFPRGTVKNLRLFTYSYNYRGMGSHSLIGQESGWDVKRILGTVPVTADGSALFNVPANTPIAIQPLDAEGRALQLMRSWFTVRPGETLSCVGCHENENSTPITRRAVASPLSPADIKPFYGPERGFSFVREIQPVLDQYCNSCHDVKSANPSLKALNFADLTLRPESHSVGHFSVAYLNLNPFVRRPGPESDYHMPVPGEWCADTSPLVQILKKGHHNVEISREAWDKLYAWIDLNVPYYGTYKETNHWNPTSELAARCRRENLKKYANLDVDYEAVPAPAAPVQVVLPKAEVPETPAPKLAGWPFSAARARELQGSAKQTVSVAPGMALNLVKIPSGEFIMGDAGGYPDERPRQGVKVIEPFWMADVEISNKLFAQFDATHDSRYQDMKGKDQTTRGYPANEPDQPVVRVSFQQAMDFCAWLSAKTGKKFTLPTEAQWEWACRAGEESPSVAELGKCNTPWGAASAVGTGGANAWGLKEMYGNVWEWTLSSYRPYPYVEGDGRNDPASSQDKVVRGGCWQDSLNRVRAGIRLSFPPYRALHHVGFRVICQE